MSIADAENFKKELNKIRENSTVKSVIDADLRCEEIVKNSIKYVRVKEDKK